MANDEQKHLEDLERELEDVRQRFKAIVETLSDGILIVDAKGKVLYSNPSADCLLNRSVAALTCDELGVPALEGADPDIGASRVVKGLAHVQARTQKTTWCGQEARLVVLTDITERMATEEEQENARQAQLRMKDEFLSRVSHELRSPLTAVYQFVTILLDGIAGDISDEQRGYLGIILRNVNQLRVMIGDLLDVTRSMSGKLVVSPRETKLADSIGAAADTVRPAANEKKLSLTIDVAEGLPAAYADPARLQQIIVNLLGNAVKFTPEGGSIRVSARVRGPLPKSGWQGAEAAAVEGAPAAWLEVSVADTGCGIGEDDHERIFLQLYQVDKSEGQNRMGLGLGLYICRELVLRMDGRIWVKSRVGEGSTFFFTVPVYSPEHAVLSLVRDRLVRAKASGETFSAVVVDTQSSAEVIRPLWEAMLAAAREKSFDAAYAGTRFVVLAVAGDAQAELIKKRLRRLAKDTCFALTSDLYLTLSYGVAVARADAESAEDLLLRAGAAAVSERSLLAQKRLIVVDDDEQGRRLIRRVMATMGLHSISTAASGPELFAALAKELPDLIVLDIQMPGMNGHEVIGRLKEKPETASIPVVVVSGYGGELSGLATLSPRKTIPVLGKLDMKELRRWVQYLL